MTNFIQVLEDCSGLLPIIRVFKKGLMPIVQIGIPLLLIIYGTIDLGKAVIASDEKEVKAAQSRLIKRFIYAALVFFIVTMVSILMNVVATGAQDEDTTSWSRCWSEA